MDHLKPANNENAEKSKLALPEHEVPVDFSAKSDTMASNLSLAAETQAQKDKKSVLGKKM